MLLQLYATMSLIAVLSSAQITPDAFQQILKVVGDMRTDMKAMSSKIDSMSTNVGDLNLRVARIENKRMTCDLRAAQWFGKLDAKLDQKTTALETKLNSVATQQNTATSEIRFNFKMLHAEIKNSAMESHMTSRLENVTTDIKEHIDSGMLQLKKELMSRLTPSSTSTVTASSTVPSAVACTTTTTTTTTNNNINTTSTNNNNNTTITAPTTPSTSVTTTSTLPPTTTVFSPITTGQKEFEECSDVYTAGITSPGSYVIKAYANLKHAVWCNQGWTTIQRIKYGGVSFDRLWTDYVGGFGDVSKDHWIGLEAMHSLTRDQRHRLRVEAFLDDRWKTQFKQDGDGKMKIIDNALFSVGASSSYTLTVRGTSTNLVENKIYASWLETDHSGRSFSTKDNDQDTHSVNCAQTYSAGWWYHGCNSANYNMPWSGCSSGAKVCIYFIDKLVANSVEMKIRR